MKRRNFIQLLGFSAVALPLLAGKSVWRVSPDTLRETLRIHPHGKVRSWEANTRYEVGDFVRFSNGQVVELQMSGTTCNVESMRGTILPLKGDLPIFMADEPFVWSD